jgi:hypothetical protein
MESLGYVSPAEFEEQHYRTQAAPAERLALNRPRLLSTPGRFTGELGMIHTQLSPTHAR